MSSECCLRPLSGLLTCQPQSYRLKSALCHRCTSWNFIAYTHEPSPWSSPVQAGTPRSLLRSGHPKKSYGSAADSLLRFSPQVCPSQESRRDDKRYYLTGRSMPQLLSPKILPLLTHQATGRALRMSGTPQPRSVLMAQLRWASTQLDVPAFSLRGVYCGAPMRSVLSCITVHHHI